MPDFINTITKIYVRSTHDSEQTHFVDTMYNHFGLRCPIQFIASISTYPYDKKKQILKQLDIHTNGDFRDTGQRVPTYDEIEYGADQWNIWKAIERDRREARKHRDVTNDVYVILDTDTTFRRSITNAYSIFAKLVGKIRDAERELVSPTHPAVTSTLVGWDMIFLSHSMKNTALRGLHGHRNTLSTALENDIDPDKLSLTHPMNNVVYVSSTIGIPTQYIRCDGNYIVSSRGIDKLFASHYNTRCIPFDEFIYRLHHCISDNDNTTSTTPPLFYAYHCTPPVFYRKPMINPSNPKSVYHQLRPFKYNRFRATWTFIIILSPLLTDEDATFVTQYGYTFGVPVITIEKGPEGQSITATPRKHIQHILITLYDIYTTIANSENLLFLYCGSRFAIPNCNPGKLIDRFITSQKDIVFANAPKRTGMCAGTSASDFDNHLLNGIWMARLSGLIVNNVERDIYSNLRDRLYHIDTTGSLFFDVSTVNREVRLNVDETARQIVFNYPTTQPTSESSDDNGEGHIGGGNDNDNDNDNTCITMDYPFLYSTIENEEVWIIFNKLINYIDTRYPLIQPIDYSLNLRAKPTLNGIQLFEHGHVAIYIPVNQWCIDMYRRYGFTKWIETIHDAFTLPKETVNDIKHLYIHSIQKEPANDTNADTPYHWAYRTGYLKKTLIFYIRLEEDHASFNEAFGLELARVNTTNVFKGLMIDTIHTISYIDLLNENLYSSKLNHTDFIWFLNPAHVLLPNLIGRISETRCKVVAPCIPGYKNPKLSTSCYNDFHKDQPVQNSELLEFVSRRWIGTWHMIHIQDTWCIHSSLFDKLRDGMKRVTRQMNEQWAQYLTRILRKYYIPIYACNRYEYGTNISL